MFNIILASDMMNGIGMDNMIPWNVPNDTELFKSLTQSIVGLKKVVIMGHNTMKSLKNGYLKNRINIVITQMNVTYDNVIVIKTFDEALECAYSMVGRDPNRVWIIGGVYVYNNAMNHPDINYIYHSRINGTYKCNKFVDIPDHNIISSDNMDGFTLNIIQLKNTAERQYLKLLHEVYMTGEKRQTRNATTYSLFGQKLSFDVSKSFPLLTTKKMFMKGIVEELLFFIRGDTDTNKLMDKGINIWKGNTTKEFLDKMKLPYEEGMMGPMYGYQWRFFNKPYNGDGPYIDQLKNIIDVIKTDPTNRRMLMTDFNPLMVDMGVLYPCHSIIIQFYVSNNMLSILMHQRSADMFLGLPFNIASTTLLLYIVAQLTNTTPHMVHITLGDCHIYEQHIDVVKEQLTRTPYNEPTLTLPKFTTLDEVEKLEYNIDTFKLTNYNFHPVIKAEMIA